MKPSTPSIPLLAAAAWNLSAALAALAAPTLHLATFYRLPVPQTPVLMTYHYSLWSFILVMGICYAIAAYDAAARRGILLVGAIGKPVAFLVWVIAFALGIGSPMLLIGGLGDLVWAFYFIHVLRQVPKAVSDAG